MKNSTVNNLKAAGKATVITSKDTQPRQVVASSNRLRVTFLKGNNNGKTNS
jgi:hypothetical protein